jgi:hypothetical protein
VRNRLWPGRAAKKQPCQQGNENEPPQSHVKKTLVTEMPRQR